MLQDVVREEILNQFIRLLVFLVKGLEIAEVLEIFVKEVVGVEEEQNLHVKDFEEETLQDRVGYNTVSEKDSEGGDKYRRLLRECEDSESKEEEIYEIDLVDKDIDDLLNLMIIVQHPIRTRIRTRCHPQFQIQSTDNYPVRNNCYYPKFLQGSRRGFRDSLYEKVRKYDKNQQNRSHTQDYDIFRFLHRNE